MAASVRRIALLATALVLGGAVVAQQTATAVIADPARDQAHPARMQQLEVPLNGALTFGLIYQAAGAGAHPTVLLLHGFPGYEQNLDLAQAIRRAGWNVVAFHYRGAWGSHGDFSFAHAMEDTLAMLRYMRTPANATRLGIDPAHIVVIGHSMGGFMAAYAGAHDPRLAGVVMISAWNIGAQAGTVTAATYARVLSEYRSNTGPLAGCTPESLLAEARQHAAAWNFITFAPAMKALPVLLLDANDGSRPAALATAAALRQAGDQEVAEQHFATDHPYSDQRIAMESAVVTWLAARHP